MSSRKQPMYVLACVGTACCLAGATLIALNVPTSAWGFVMFLGNSISWLTVALVRRDGPLAVLNLGYTAINLIGIWRWLL